MKKIDEKKIVYYMLVVVVSNVASQQEGFEVRPRHFCVEFACSPGVCVGFLSMKLP